MATGISWAGMLRGFVVGVGVKRNTREFEEKMGLQFRKIKNRAKRELELGVWSKAERYEREHEELGIDDVVEVVASLLGSAPPSIQAAGSCTRKKFHFYLWADHQTMCVPVLHGIGVVATGDGSQGL